MSEQVARPAFFEGQVLRAADLVLGVDYARGQLARHERYLHTPGIATGLALTVDESTGVTQVKLSPGIAIDATGREIVVSVQETLAPEDLDRLGVLIPADTDASLKQEDRPWHPVYLVGRDVSETMTSPRAGCGPGAGAGQIAESYELSYGRPGEEAEQPELEVSDGPVADSAVRVLIGFVQWDGANGFGAAQAAPLPGLAAPYAGARADEVVARGGTLTLRSDLGEAREKRPALVLDGEQGGELRFGLQDAKGDVNEVFTVTAAGDLTVAGTITALTASGVLVESGVIFDGMQVPLPQGVTQQQIDDGRAVLHVTVTPRLTSEVRPPGATSGTWLKEPFECRATGRRVYVRERWFGVTPVAGPQIHPAACNYLTLAYIAGGPS